LLLPVDGTDPAEPALATEAVGVAAMQSGDGTAEKIMRRVETGGGANEVHGFSRKCDSRVFQCAYAQLIQIRAWLLRVSPNIAKKNFGMVEEASFVSKPQQRRRGLVVTRDSFD
jgi:hypothetical protein